MAFWIGQAKMYDASATDGKVCKGYKGVGTDGQYIYYTPFHNGSAYHGVVLRQKIYAVFSDSGSWEAYDAGATNGLAAKGFAGNPVFDGRFMYFVPSNNGSPHGIVLRYDTTKPFKDAGSWEAYNAGSVGGLATKGFSGGVFDGERFIYFIPFYNGAYNGIIMRFDTAKPFKDSGSWEAYDFGSLAGGAAKGYSGGEIVDGFLYLSPFQNTSAKHGKIVRYALSKPFKVAGSWEVFDATAVASDAKALGQPCTDGRFVYFPNAYYEIVLRYDTQKPFGQAASYDYFNLSTLCWNVAAHNACCKQGTHIVFAPDDSNLLAYDTEKPFADSGSWADREVLYAKDMHTFGFRGCYSDPNYIYFAPWAYHGSVYHGSVARMRVDPCPGQSLPLPGSSEDLSKYMYYESGVASVSSSRATGYYDDASVWGLVFQDYEKDFFDGFVIQFDFKLVSAYLSDAVESIATELGLFSLSNAHYPWDEVYSLPADDPVVVISVYWNEDGELDSAELNLVEGNWYSYSSTLNISVGTVYYCTISRSDGSSTVTLKVYSNAARTTLLKTMTVTSFTASRKWRFIYALRGMSDADGMASATVWVENLKIVSY